MAVRYGRGTWPGLRTDWLMAEDMFPVCSPSLLTGRQPLRTPEDLAHHTLLHATVSREDWQLWLTAAGLPVSLATRRGLSFDQSFMAIQAAVEGLGIALGRTRFVEADIAAGRLVVPFDVVLPADAGFYIVAPETPPMHQDRPIPRLADHFGGAGSGGAAAAVGLRANSIARVDGDVALLQRVRSLTHTSALKGSSVRARTASNDE